MGEKNGTGYVNPAVSVDVLVFTVSGGELSLLLIRRSEPPFAGSWAIPGGFLGETETAEETAGRKLLEKTGVSDPHLEQLCTVSTLERDPRMRVVTIAYLALIPYGSLRFNPGVGAVDIGLFAAREQEDGRILWQNREKGIVLAPEDLAFDHGSIAHTALARLKGKVEYTDIAMSLLEDRERFTLVELQEIYEAILGRSLDPGNFRRDIRKRYEASGKIENRREKETLREGSRGPRPVLYRWIAQGRGPGGAA